MTAKTRVDLVETIARRMGGYFTGTATGGSTSTVVDTAGLYFPDDYWCNHYVYIVTDAGGAHAAPEGQERLCTDFDRASATLTVDPVFSAAVGVGDTYEILRVRREEIEEAINSAIREAAGTWPVVVVDTSTITLADDDYDYNLPAALGELRRVWYRGDSDEAYKLLDGSLWQVSGTPGAQELELRRLTGLEAGDNLRLEYVKRAAEMSSDSSTLGVGEPVEAEGVEFVCWWAVMLLHHAAAAAGGGDFREHLTLAGDAEKKAERKRQGAKGAGGPGTVKTRRWPRAR